MTALRRHYVQTNTVSAVPDQASRSVVDLRKLEVQIQHQNNKILILKVANIMHQK